MTKKIFHSILLVAGTVLLASLLVIMGCLYEYFGSVEKKQLRDELELAAVAVEENGTEYLSQLSSERYRLTWIENDGTVLYDTVTDAESLENHADRVEVKQALEYGEGESTRYSSTLLQKTMYCAERLADGSVLRISMSRATAGVLLVGMGQPILVVLIVALILSSVLAKSLSHRIVQPLNKLDLEHPLENDAYEELAPLLGRINRQHLQIDEQMDELQRQQTEFSQITSSMREGLVLLDEKERVLSINPAAAEQHIAIAVEGGSETIGGVRRLLYEVIYNLCDNAIKYNVEGGSVTMSVGERDGKAFVSVADTGIGIAPEHQSRIFERFYRVDKSHSKASGGTGLGLSIVKHAVQYHHGTVELHSEEGKGTTICILLPKE